MTSLNNARLRKRKRCRKCNQELSHSAYTRHLNPAVCPEVRSGTVLSVLREDNMHETITESVVSNEAFHDQDLGEGDANDAEASESIICSNSENSSKSSSEDEGQSQECISGSEEIDSLSASDNEEQTALSEEQSKESLQFRFACFLVFFNSAIGYQSVLYLCF